MKLTKNVLVLIPALTVLAVGTANANNIESYQALHSLQHSVYNSPSLSVTVNDGVATIAGDVDSSIEKYAVERIVSNAPGVDSVINIVTTN